MSANIKIPQTHHRLSIHIGVNGLSFIVEDTQTKDCLLWRNQTYTFPGNDYNEWAKEVGYVFKQEELLQKRFACCDVMIDTHKHTLIPTSIFKAEQAIEVLKQLFDVAYLDQLFIRQCASGHLYLRPPCSGQCNGFQIPAQSQVLRFGNTPDVFYHGTK